MKKYLSIAVAALFFPALGAAPLTVADGKQSGYTVVIPDGTGDRQMDGFIALAGELVRTCIRKASGAELKLVRETAFDKKGPAIFVGNTRALAQAGLSSAKFDYWEHAIAARGKDIFIYGKDIPNTRKNVSRHFIHCVNGTLKGACTFVEKFVNTRVVVYRGDQNGVHDGVRTLPQKLITIPENYSYRNRPEFMNTAGNSMGLLYMVANNWLFYAGCAFNPHSHATAVPQEKLFKTNPEYFAFIDGKRYYCPGGRQPHYCLSNPKVQALIYQDILKRADTGAQMVEVGQSDGFKPCECEKCKAWYGTADWGEKLWCFHRDLAAQLHKDRPGVRLCIMCYGPTHNTPRSFKRFPSPNVVIDVAPPSINLLNEWKQYNIQGIVSWTYFFGCYLASGFTPARSFAALNSYTKMLHGKKIRGIYNCGQFTAPSLEGPWYYAYGKWLGDQSIPAEKLLDDYCVFSFGPKAAPAFKAFFKAIDKRLELCPLPSPITEDWNDMDRAAAKQVLTIPFWQKRYPEKVMKELDALFDRAVALCDPANPDLNALKTEYEYMRRSAAVCNAKKAYDDSPDDAGLSRLLDAVSARNKFLDALPESRKRPGKVDGSRCYLFATLKLIRDGGYMRGRFGGIFEADRKLIEGARRGTTAVKVSSFTDPAWTGAPVQTLRPMKKGTPELAAQFRAGFNDSGLFLKLSVPFDNGSDKVKVKRDGGAWLYPCFEIALFPAEGGPGRHYILNFDPASCYDAEVSFRNGKKVEDPKWNGKWNYVSRRKGKVWETDLFIPFGDLGQGSGKPEKVRLQVGFSITSAEGHYTWNQPLDGSFVSETGLGGVTLGKTAKQVSAEEYHISEEWKPVKNGRLPKYWATAPSGKVKYRLKEGVLTVFNDNPHRNVSAWSRRPAFVLKSANDKVTLHVSVSGKGKVQIGSGLYAGPKWVVNRHERKVYDLKEEPQELSHTWGPDADFLRGVDSFTVSVILRGVGEMSIRDVKVRVEHR